ncbi:hypothetical protein [Rhodococcus koreensis]
MDHNESVGAGPDVLAYDLGAHRLYVAAESGTHHSYYPVPSGADGRPALLEQGPAP